MRWFGVVEVAAVRGGGKRLVAAVHHDTPRGLRAVLDGGGYDEWIVGCTDPEGLRAALSLPSEQ